MNPFLRPCLHRKTDQHGLSLVELMVAMVLGLVLIGGVVGIYLASRASGRTERGLSDVQETGRFAFAFMAPDIRLAGYLGCSRGNPNPTLTNALTNSTDYIYRFAIGTGIRGFDATPGGTTWSPALNDTNIDSGLNSLTSPPVHGSDVLTLRAPEGPQVKLVDPITATSSSMTVTPADKAPFNAAGGDVAMISDCTQSTVFEVTSYDASTGKIGYAGSWGAYQPGASVDKFHTVSYFVASRSGQFDCSKYDCSLWKKDGAENAAELVDGVENMQILYGVDTDTDGIPNQYVTAGNALLGVDAAHQNWINVVSVKVALLVASGTAVANGATPAAQSYELLNQTITTHDRRLRQVFTQTFTLRNRIM